jgi:hypothetical protein
MVPLPPGPSALANVVMATVMGDQATAFIGRCSAHLVSHLVSRPDPTVQPEPKKAIPSWLRAALADAQRRQSKDTAPAAPVHDAPIAGYALADAATPNVSTCSERCFLPVQSTSGEESEEEPEVAAAAASPTPDSSPPAPAMPPPAPAPRDVDPQLLLRELTDVLLSTTSGMMQDIARAVLAEARTAVPAAPAPALSGSV